MNSLFYPESIAVVGATPNTEKLGYIIPKNIIDSHYNGKLFLINPKYDEILDKTANKTILEINAKIDVTIIVIPAAGVVDIIKQIGEQKQISNNHAESYVVVISAGFGETGEGGKVVEKEILQIAKNFNIKIVGPNCLGIMNLSDDKLAYNGTFDFRPKISGSVSLISQSGALISGILEEASSQGFGFNKIISLGNKSDINENDLIQYLQNDPETAVIALYLESFSEGRKLIEIAKKCPKPIVLLKSGRTDQAKTAATLHTGSIAGNEKVAESFLESADVIDVFSTQEFFDTLKLFSKKQSLKDNNICIITNAGGLGVISLDGLAGTELKLLQISQELGTQLKNILPAAASTHNPIDILGDAGADRYLKTMETVLKSDSNLKLLVILTPQVSSDVVQTAQAVVDLSKNYPDSLLIPVFIGGDRVTDAINIFKNSSIPYFDTPERALKAINDLWIYSSKKVDITNIEQKQNSSDREEISDLLAKNILNKNKILDFKTVTKIAQNYGLQMPRYMQIKNLTDLDNVFDTLGRPVVIKSVKTDLLHRTEKKAVLTGVSKVSDITSFLDENDLHDVIFQESIEKGLEVFAGIQNDPNFGHVLVVGTGGIYAEVMDDFALGPIPKSIDEVKEIFNKTKVSKILSNFRNINFDSHELYQQVFRLCQFVSDFPEVSSVDANPMIVTADECFIVDLKISIEK